MSEVIKDIKGLCFDKDGTLFDFSATWEAWAKGFLLRLCDGDQTRAAKMGTRIGFDLEAQKFARDSVFIAGTPEDIVAAIAPSFPDLSPAQVARMINEEAAQAPQQEAVPLRPLLSTLRAKGLKLGVATNDAEHPARVHLEGAGVVEMFDFIAGSDTGHGGKPAPGQLLAFAAHVALLPRQIAMIGDSTHDLHAGRAAGMACVAVLTGIAREAELAPFADVVLPDIGYLPAWLGLSERL